MPLEEGALVLPYPSHAFALVTKETSRPNVPFAQGQLCQVLCCVRDWRALRLVLVGGGEGVHLREGGTLTTPQHLL